MHRSYRARGRNAKTMAVLAAATGLVSLAHSASAQTWVNPNSGSWSVGSNWVGGLPPVPSPTTALQFNATGAQSYSSFNNIAAGFVLNTLTTNNTGTGVITVTGLGLGGGTTTSGPNVIVNNAANSTSLINLGGTAYSLRVQQGTLDVSGATWTLTSTQRQNDPVGGIDDGRWSLNVGEVSGQTARFNMSGGSLTAAQGFQSVANDSVSVSTFSNGAHATFDPVVADALGRWGVNAGDGTINVLSGAVVDCRLAEFGKRKKNFDMKKDINKI